MTRIYVYVKNEPTLITDQVPADMIFDDHGKAASWLAQAANLPNPTPTQDEKLTAARAALANLQCAARSYSNDIEAGDWTREIQDTFERAMAAASEWLVSDAHAAATRSHNAWEAERNAGRSIDQLK
ncbi:hypothetical protein ACODYM_28835 [Burkholderia gladioli]|uniref:hypothetical protein n=1 Tax=Burkholderia gladioli TaxID=28095 RepID=UPI003B50CD1D